MGGARGGPLCSPEAGRAQDPPCSSQPGLCLWEVPDGGARWRPAFWLELRPEERGRSVREGPAEGGDPRVEQRKGWGRGIAHRFFFGYPASYVSHGGNVLPLGVQPLRLHAQWTVISSPVPLCQLAFTCTSVHGPRPPAGLWLSSPCLNHFCTYQLQSSSDSTSSRGGAETRVSTSILGKE